MHVNLGARELELLCSYSDRTFRQDFLTHLESHLGKLFNSRNSEVDKPSSGLSRLQAFLGFDDIELRFSDRPFSIRLEPLCEPSLRFPACAL